MVKTTQKILQEINQKTIGKEGTVPQDFFIGITNNPQKKLFIDHRVNPIKGCYTFYEANSNEEAVKIFNELKELDMNGYISQKNSQGKYVYCYYIDEMSKEIA